MINYINLFIAPAVPLIVEDILQGSVHITGDVMDINYIKVEVLIPEEYIVELKNKVTA